MRRCVLVILVLLLPLRVWATMWVPEMGPAPAAMAAMPDCHEVGQPMKDAHAMPEGLSDDPVGCHCDSCQLCLPLAGWALPALAWAEPLQLVQAHGGQLDTSFTNADLSRLLRPPST